MEERPSCRMANLADHCASSLVPCPCPRSLTPKSSEQMLQAFDNAKSDLRKIVKASMTHITNFCEDSLDHKKETILAFIKRFNGETQAEVSRSLMIWIAVFFYSILAPFSCKVSFPNSQGHRHSENSSGQHYSSRSKN